MTWCSKSKKSIKMAKIPMVWTHRSTQQGRSTSSSTKPIWVYSTRTPANWYDAQRKGANASTCSALTSETSWQWRRHWSTGSGSVPTASKTRAIWWLVAFSWVCSNRWRKARNVPAAWLFTPTAESNTAIVRVGLWETQAKAMSSDLGDKFYKWLTLHWQTLWYL
jgi:hypothetical protein